MDYCIFIFHKIFNRLSIIKINIGKFVIIFKRSENN